MKKRIAFIKLRRDHPFPLRVQRLLYDLFPDFEVETVEVADLIRKDKGTLVRAILMAFRDYGVDIVLGRKRFRESIYRTSYIFKQITSLVSHHLSQRDYLFTFQDQSIFDASIEGLPHFVYTDHTHLANLSYPDFDQTRLYTQSWIELEKTIYQNATLTFTRSSNITRSVIEDYACRPEKVVCVYYAGSAELGSDNVNENKYYSKNILFVGIDWERKGGPDLIEAFSQVLKVHPDAHLTVVGCSPNLDVPNCNVVGLIPLDEVPYYYNQSSIFCLPSKLEPAANVCIEAMSHKLPIVASNVGAMPDFVCHGENGFLINPGDIDQLAAALINLIGEPEKCRTFGEAGWNIVAERYTWEKVGAKLKENILAVVRG